MPKIITITFSPAIDKSASIPALIPEKKLKCSKPKMEPGGGGINVSRAIKKLGGDSLAIYPIGGFAGEYFRKLMEKENISSMPVECHAATRENMVIYDEASGLQYRFGMPGPPLEENEWRQMLGMLESVEDVGYVVVSGSFPPGVGPEVMTEIVKITSLKKARLVIDTTGDALKKAAEHGVYLLKPNISELASMVNKKSIELEEVDDAGRELIKKGSAEVIVVSMGAAGALLITKDKEKQYIPPRIKIKSTVGAGDSMVAGIIYSLASGKDLDTSVCFGVACGTAATMNTGTELFKPEDVKRINAYIEKTAPK